MRELSERAKRQIISAIVRDNLVLCYAPLRGTNPTIVDRVSSPNSGALLNLLFNGDFEVGAPPTGWTAGPNATLSQVTSPVKSGSYALKMIAASADYAYALQQLATTAYNNLTLTLGAWVQGTGTKGYLSLQDGTNNYKSGYATPDGKWHWLEATGVIAAGATYVNAFMGTDTTGTYHYDGAVLYGNISQDGTFTNGKWKTLENGLVVPYFDGTAYIKKSTADWRITDSQGAIGVWFKLSVIGATQEFFSSCDERTNDYLFLLRVHSSNKLSVFQTSNDASCRVDGGTNLVANKWYSAFLTSDGTIWSIYLNGVPETLTVNTGTNNGDWLADTANRSNFAVGVSIRNTLVAYLYGQIGLVVVYSVAPSVAQILRMHNRLRGVFH